MITSLTLRRRRVAAAPLEALQAFCASALALLCLVTVLAPQQALAQEAKPSFLIVDANLGDFDQCSLYWLGEDAAETASSDGLTLRSAKHPLWWVDAGGEGDGPQTFLLGSTEPDTPLTVDHITWALDTIRSSGAEPRTFVLGIGASGLVVREYVEDLASTPQSSRADIVGVGFCGTPQNGYTALSAYPESDLWSAVEGSTSFSAADLEPGSKRLAALNAATLPKVVKVLSVEGNVGDLGYGLTDGAGTFADFALSGDVGGQMVSNQVKATLSQQVNLTSCWMPLTSSIDFGSRALDHDLAERLSAMSCYATSADTQKLVREFYDAWYATGAPVTHNSDVMALDLSGSMFEEVSAGTAKIDAAKRAAREYLTVMSACAQLPLSAPADIEVLGFAEDTSRIVEGYGDTAQAAVKSIDAKYQETDMGKVLDMAVADLASSPVAAKRHILLLSDGASTQGKSNDQMMAGAVRQAKEQGIIIDAVGFGDAGESNEGFLKQITKETGGTYYFANDTYELRVNFLTSYYDSLGMQYTDADYKSGTAQTDTVATADANTRAIQVSMVFDRSESGVQLLCDGEAVDPGAYTVTSGEGLVTLECDSPDAGDYTVKVDDGADKFHVFAVRQLGIPDVRVVSAEAQDYSLYLLIGAGVLLAAGLVAVALVTLKNRR